VQRALCPVRCAAGGELHAARPLGPQTGAARSRAGLMDWAAYLRPWLRLCPPLGRRACRLVLAQRRPLGRLLSQLMLQLASRVANYSGGLFCPTATGAPTMEGGQIELLPAADGGRRRESAWPR